MGLNRCIVPPLHTGHHHLARRDRLDIVQLSELVREHHGVVRQVR